MSLGIVFKGPEGLVLAADSRVTLTAQVPNQKLLLPATYDNVTKLLKVQGQDYVGAVTYGLGAIGQRAPRTTHGFLPEFERKLSEDAKDRLEVASFAQELSDFYMDQWALNMPNYKGKEEMVFLVGGFDENATYGRVFEVGIPFRLEPKEWHKDGFGAVWGRQREFTDRLIQGFDPRLIDILKNTLALSDDQLTKLDNELKKQLSVKIPYPFLPLQDCVDLSIFLIRATMSIQTWHVGIRGVGGAIDVATITGTDGFQPVQQKRIKGESSIWEEY